MTSAEIVKHSIEYKRILRERCNLALADSVVLTLNGLTDYLANIASLTEPCDAPQCQPGAPYSSERIAEARDEAICAGIGDRQYDEDRDA